ncbi:myosin-4-like isoform X2 [Corvus hawaiiensis]|uniref:myosin-4-like isoform X2 n=1 Tax=Corvus hawaiiensis TaxID=134902 RepID=UPI002019FA33|nr:myosin-4-like isoform X2 [Corvus hawaiiensis]
MSPQSKVGWLKNKGAIRGDPDSQGSLAHHSCKPGTRWSVKSPFQFGLLHASGTIGCQGQGLPGNKRHHKHRHVRLGLRKAEEEEEGGCWLPTFPSAAFLPARRLPSPRTGAVFSGRAAAMASVSLLELLDEAIGTPEVNVNLEALRKLLRVILEHLSLLGLQDVIPQGAVPGPQEEGGGSSTEAGAWGRGQPPRGQLPGKDKLQGTRSGPPVTSVAADMGQMEKTEAKESGISKATALSQEPHKEMAGTEAVQSNMGEEIQRIKEALGQTTDLCKDLRKEVNEMKAAQSRMGEGIRMIQEALGQDAAAQPLVPHHQSALAKPHTSDMDKLGQSRGAQPGSQAGHPAMESIIRNLSELQGQMSSLQSLARDLQGEKEKIRQLEDAVGKLGVTVAKCEVDGTNQIPLQLESALQEINQEQKELREEQKITKATLKQLVTADQLQERLNELRAMMGSAGQEQGESQTVCPDRSSESKLVRKLLHRCEKLQEQVDSLVPHQVQRSLPQKTQDEELLKSIQATVMRVEGDCEQLSYITGSLRDDHHQHQKHIEALFRSLEGLEKKADKEDLLLLKVDKAALGNKVSCAHFDASMERLEERLRELLRRVSGQEQRWKEAQQQFSDALDSKLDRLELGPFQKQLEDTWARTIKDLRDELSVELDNAAGIKQQLLIPYNCLSCDRHLNIQVPGPHIDTLPLFPLLPSSHATRLSTVTTEEQAQQHSHRKLVSSKFVKSQSCRRQDMSNTPPKDVLWLSKKLGVTELLGTDDRVDRGKEHLGSEVAKRAQDELGTTTLLEHQPASDLNH